MVVCEACGKKLKNEHGLAIHKGHMHSLKRNLDLEAEVQSLKQMVADLTDLVRTMKAQGGNGGDNIDWKPLSELTTPSLPVPSTGMNYGADHQALLKELKSHFKTS
jgi:hypothetical protein